MTDDGFDPDAPISLTNFPRATAPRGGIAYERTSPSWLLEQAIRVDSGRVGAVVIWGDVLALLGGTVGGVVGIGVALAAGTLFTVGETGSLIFGAVCALVGWLGGYLAMSRWESRT